MLVICLKLFDVSYRQIESSSFLSLLIVCVTTTVSVPGELADPLLSWAESQVIRSLDAVGHTAADLPLHAANGLQLNELSLTGPQPEFNQVVAFFVAFDREPTQLELELLLQSVVLGEILVEVGNSGLVFVLILVNFVGGLGLGVEALSLLTLLLAERLEFGGSVEYRAHHDLARHGEAGGVHLAEDDRALLPRIDLNVIAGAAEGLLELELVELGVVDVLAVLGFLLVVDDVDVTVALLSHGKVLSDARGALLSKVGCLALCELLFGTAAHKLTDQIDLVE